MSNQPGVDWSTLQQVANTHTHSITTDNTTTGGYSGITFPATTTIGPGTWTQTGFTYPPPIPGPDWRGRARVSIHDEEEIPTDGSWTVLGEGRCPQTWTRFIVIEHPGLPLIPPGGVMTIYHNFEAVRIALRAKALETLAW